MAKQFNVPDFQQSVDKFIHDLPKEVVVINNKIALNAIARITARLTDQGITAEGKSLGSYSIEPLNPLFFLGHGLAQADAKVKSKVKQEQKAHQPVGISYKDWRDFNNLPTDHVTLSFTGDTLGDIGVLNELIDGAKIVTTVGSKDSKSKDIYNKKGVKTGSITTGQVLDNLNAKYGQALGTDLLTLSAKEEEEAAKVLDAMIQGFLNTYF